MEWIAFIIRKTKNKDEKAWQYFSWIKWMGFITFILTVKRPLLLVLIKKYPLDKWGVSRIDSIWAAKYRFICPFFFCKVYCLYCNVWYTAQQIFTYAPSYNYHSDQSTELFLYPGWLLPILSQVIAHIQKCPQFSPLSQ